jgi:hypothetical protein
LADDERPGWIADRLSSARTDAERIARELLRDGRIGADEVATLAAAVDEAVARGRALIENALRAPRRLLTGMRQAASDAAPGTGAAAATSTTEAPSARIAHLEARVAALEALVGVGKHGPRGEGEGI